MEKKKKIIISFNEKLKFPISKFELVSLIFIFTLGVFTLLKWVFDNESFETFVFGNKTNNLEDIEDNEISLTDKERFNKVVDMVRSYGKKENKELTVPSNPQVLLCKITSVVKQSDSRDPKTKKRYSSDYEIIIFFDKNKKYIDTTHPNEKGNDSSCNKDIIFMESSSEYFTLNSNMEQCDPWWNPMYNLNKYTGNFNSERSYKFHNGRVKFESEFGRCSEIESKIKF